MPSPEEITAALDGASAAKFDDVLRAQFRTLQREMPQGLAGVLRQVHEGDLKTSAAKKAAFDVLAEGHGNGAYLGRRLAGNDSPFGDFDVEFGKLVADGQAPYVEGFIADIQGGRYTDDEGRLDENAITARADLYEERLRGTANEVWSSSLDPSELIDWILGGDEDSACTVCPDLAENGPYSPGDMPTWPGACETPCMLNCRCEAKTQSGQSGF